MTANRRERLLDAVAALDADGYLLDASTTDPNQRFVTGFEVGDPFVSLVTGDGLFQLFWGVDHETALSRGVADKAYAASDFGYEGFGDPAAKRRVVRQFVRRHDVDAVAVPERFPVGTARALEPAVTVTVADSDPVTSLRARKSPPEVAHVRAAAEAADAAMAAVDAVLAKATETADGLALDGDLVTGEDAERRIRDVLAEHDCTAEEVLVACGTDAADPHGATAGALQAEAPIVVDVVPRQPDGYHADVCRTFFVGTPPERVQAQYELVRETLDAVAAALEPGVTAAGVDDVLCGRLEDRGVETPRTDPDAEAGALHYMAHGVGLSVHEAPFCAPDSDAVLEPGAVLAVEPAVYDPSWGGVRVEDVFEVTADGSRRLSTADLRPGRS